MCHRENKTISGISLTWPQTPAGETSTLSCPNTDGNATRNCTAEGVWEQPYVRDCFTCPLESNTTSGVALTWPLTPAGETAVQPCPDTDRNATRYCSAEGVWEQPYVRECLTCPQEANTTSDSGVTLTWPPTIAGETSTLSCPNTDRNATRNCTVEGVWEQPYVRECFTCSLESNITSGVALTWPLTPAGETSVQPCPDTDRNATRYCSAEGVWEQPYVRECLTCPQEANITSDSGVALTWPPTIAGETSVQPCPDTNRSATRNCSAEGVWEQPYIRECLTCSLETNTTMGVTLTWPPTIVGETSTLSCPDTNGNATRNCTAEGVWEQPYVRDCFTCPLETNTTSGVALTWPLTPAGETAVQPCPDTDRNATRKCSVEGVWEQPYVRKCLTCPQDTNTTSDSGITLTWPPTIAGETSTLSCPNTDGNATRNCTAEGVWEQPYVRECFTCSLESNTTSGINLTWPQTPAGETSVQPCPNAVSNASRNCSAEGVWEQPYVQECLTCPQEANTLSDVALTWPPTIAGETSALSCPNTGGTATRNCSVVGVWEKPYVQECLACPLEANTLSDVALTWPPTIAGETSVISCPNTDGTATRKCTAEGVWEKPYVQECLACPLEANTLSGVALTWPPTIAGETSTLSCPNTNGTATRNCSVEGVWEQPYVCDCLTQGISQQLCNVCDSIPSLCTVVVLMLSVPSLLLCVEPRGHCISTDEYFYFKWRLDK